MNRWRGALAAITVVAFGLRMAGLENLGDLDFDEQASFFIGSKPPAEMLAYLLAAPFEHPPLFYLLFHVWLGAVGGTETAMRMFSVLAGTLTVPLVGLIAMRAGGPKTCLAAASLLAVLPLHVFHSRDARMYPLLGLFGALALAGLVVPASSRTRPWGIGLALAAGLAALATHYYAVFGVLGVIAGLAVSSGRQRARPPVRNTLSTQHSALSTRSVPLAGPLTIAGVVVGGVIWVMQAPGLQTSLSVVRPRPVPPADLAVSVAQSLGAAFSGPLAPPGWFLLCAALAGLVLVLVARLGDVPTADPVASLALRPLALWGFLVPTLAVPLLALLGRPFAPRFVAMAIPCLAILVGLAAHRLSAKGVLLGGAALGVATLPGLLPIYGGYVRSDYGHALAALRAEARPDDAIVLNGPWQDILYRRYGWGLPAQSIVASTVPLEASEATGRLEALTATKPRIWVVDSATDAADPDGVVAGWLDEHAYPRPVIPFEKALLRPYLTDYGRPATWEVRATTAAGLGVRLEQVALDAWTLRPGSEARIRIDARLEPATGSRRLVGRLVAPSGVEIWHGDGALLQSRSLTSRDVAFRAAIVVPGDAGEGAYRLEALVYEPVTRSDGSRGVDGLSEPLDLGTVHLVKS